MLFLPNKGDMNSSFNGVMFIKMVSHNAQRVVDLDKLYRETSFRLRLFGIFERNKHEFHDKHQICIIFKSQSH